MLKRIYLSPFGLIISLLLQLFGRVFSPFMVYGYWNQPTRSFRRLTRISSTAVLNYKGKINIGDNCWIWHHSIIDGSNGVKIGEGVQVGAWVGIFTHGSHLAIRLLGDEYVDFDESSRIGYVRGSVEVGDYSFIASSVSIMPGVKIGRGCIITAGAVVTKDIPDYSIASGNPARCVGSTLELDKRYFSNPVVRSSYFDPEAMENYLESEKMRRKRNQIG
jgi:acetyltransferase-like isoleucine patch superfamily enzyme